jgi:hypothetical protein
VYKYLLFTHLAFDIKFNGDRVIEVNVLTDPGSAVDISDSPGSVKVRGRPGCVRRARVCVCVGGGAGAAQGQGQGRGGASM